MTVAHLVRKRSQLDSSFIYNQIRNHVDFSPVIIYAYDDQSRGLADFPIQNYNYHDLSWMQSRVSKIRLHYTFQSTKRNRDHLRKLIKQIHPEVIHLHYGSDAALFLPYIQRIGIPTVVSFYGYDCTGFPKYYMGLGLQILKNRVFPYAQFITAMSEDMRNDLIRIGCPSDRLRVHYHGIDTSLFRVDRKPNRNKNVKLLIISSLTPQKGHLFLLRAFRKVVQKHKNVFLTIVGDGPEKNKIRKYIRESEIPNIRLKNYVDFASAEHLRYLEESDIFIHPSITDERGNKEGIPGSLVEAMVAGLPVISTFHAGIPHIVKHRKTGLLVGENDCKALESAITEMLEDKKLRTTLGKNAMKYANENLDIRVKEANLEQLYLDAISDRS